MRAESWMDRTPLIKEKLPSPNEVYTDAELTKYARQYAFIALNAIEEMKK